MEGLGKIYCSLELAHKKSIQVRFSPCVLYTEWIHWLVRKKKKLVWSREVLAVAVFAVPCWVPTCTQRKGKRWMHCKELSANFACWKTLTVNERLLIFDVSLLMHCSVTFVKWWESLKAVLSNANHIALYRFPGPWPSGEWAVSRSQKYG